VLIVASSVPKARELREAAPIPAGPSYRLCDDGPPCADSCFRLRDEGPDVSVPV
jgi:hypothetical protein